MLKEREGGRKQRVKGIQVTRNRQGTGSEEKGRVVGGGEGPWWRGNPSKRTMSYGRER